MQTTTIINQDYQGATRNPHGEALARLTQQFRNVRGPEQLRECLRAWGIGDISGRQARFWAQSTETERRLFCDMAQVSISYRLRPWREIPDQNRQKLWRAILDATQWGERLRGRF